MNEPSQSMAPTASRFTAIDGEAEMRAKDNAYRSISKAAVASSVFGFLSISAWLDFPFAVIPIVGIGFGALAVVHLRKYPDELSGARIAKVGMALSAFFLLTGVGMNTYIYLTEVPEGYERISFRMLDVDEDAELPYSKEAEQLDGKKVFLRGWVRPGDRKKKLKKFILVGDFGSCCFGGNPKISDVVGVVIQTDETVDYSFRMRRIGGTFRLVKEAAKTGESEVPRVFYQIEADYIR